MHSRRHSSKLKRSLTSAKKRVTKLRRSLKKSMKKSGSKSKRTRSLRKSLKKAKKSLKSAQKKSSSKKGSKKASKRRTRRTRENIAEFKCNVKKAKSNTKEALIKEIRSYVNCVEKKTGTNQDMPLSRLREEPVSQLKQFLSFYRKEY